MTWATNLQNDSEVIANFVRITCRVQILYTDWILYSGQVYYVDMSIYGPAIGLVEKDFVFTDYTPPGLVLSAGYFKYVHSEKRLYMRKTDSSVPDVDDFFVTEFQLFYASKEVLWYRTPNDDTTDLVNWVGTLKTCPEYQISAPQYPVGFLPIDSTSLVLADDQSLNYLLYYGSFNRTNCETWSQVGPLEVDNIEAGISGVLGMEVVKSGGEIKFQVLDKAIKFDQRVPSFYITDDGTDPQFRGSPLLRFWGDNLEQEEPPIYQMIGIDYVDASVTTADNRTHVLIYDPDGDYNELVIPGRLNIGGTDFGDLTDTTNQYYFINSRPVWFDSDSSSANDNYLEVDFYDTGTDLIHFTTATSGPTNDPGNYRITNFPRVYLIKDGVRAYLLKYGRDYEQTTFSSIAVGITLRSTAEANVSFGRTFNPTTDSVWCEVCGKSGRPTYSATPINSTKRFYSNGIAVLYDFLKDDCGLAESEINFDSFSDLLETDEDFLIYLPVPFAQFTDMPTQREVLDMLLTSMLLKAFFNEAGELTITPYLPLTTSDFDIPKEDTISRESRFNYGEITKIQLQYAWDAQMDRRIATSGTKAQILAGTAPLVLLDRAQIGQVLDATGSNFGDYLHQSLKSTLIQHLTVSDSPGDFPGRIRKLFSERSGIHQVETKKQNLSRDVGDIANVQDPTLVGFEYDGSTQENLYEIIELSKASEKVEMTLDDRKATTDDWS